ncbi:MAG: GerW family sporulation protein [Clostridia bacterium]|nr:GerW family sporulation protein [Clostridia bacterium]
MHPVESIIQTTMTQLKSIVDVTTIVGNPVYSDGNSLVLPVSKVCFGFFAGGGEYSMQGKAEKAIKQSESEGDYPFLGTAVAGVSVTPKAFLSVKSGQASVLPAEYDNTIDRLVEMIPQVMCEIKQAIVSCKKQKEGEESDK